MDDTICDLENTLKSTIYNEYKIRIDINTSHGVNLNKKNIVLYRNILSRKGFYHSLQPIPGSIEAVKKMMEEYDVYICTSPLVEYEHHINEKYTWIDKYLPGLRGKIYVCTDKTLLNGDILIDSKINMGLYKPTWRQIIYDRPFNQPIDAHPRMNTWDKWREIF